MGTDRRLRRGEIARGARLPVRVSRSGKSEQTTAPFVIFVRLLTCSTGIKRRVLFLVLLIIGNAY